MKLVSIQHASKRFGRIQAVSDVSLSLHSGEILGLLGANGSGKTSLIRMICGLLRPDQGTISVAGHPGYMCQTFSLVDELSVHENIRFYGALHHLSSREIAEREAAIIQSLQLESYRDRRVSYLPSGGKQALSFSITLLSNPSILILDEPTSGLDALSRRRMWKMIREKAEEGAGIIVSTHYLDEAFLCSRLAVMHTGQLTAYGTPREIAETQEGLLQFFRP